jgi:hypothetical protein
MTSFHQFRIFAASRGEGLPLPKLRALLKRAAAAPFSEVSIGRAGLVQAGTESGLEIVSRRLNVRPFSRELARPVVAARIPEEKKLPKANRKSDHIV